jgi:penicillin-binding protein 2
MDRLSRVWISLLAILVVLLIRLVHLQLIRGGHYRHLAEQNRLRLISEQAPRGLIVDRQGRILASNQTVFRVALVPQDLEDLSAVLERVSAIVGRSPDMLRREFKREQTLAFVPATIVSRVPKDVAIRLEEERWRLPGLLVKPDTVRYYPMGSSLAHVLGYLSQPTPEELPLLKQYGVRPKELVGRSGVERLLDHALRGRPGGLMVEVDHRARQIRTIGRRPPEAGSRVALTVDASLQSLIEEMFRSQPGACVVLQPQTGEVLAMVSVPGFSPEAFTLGGSEAVTRYLDDAEAPLMNRAAVGVYQPGSIMKLITAAAGLEHQLITPSSIINCPGSLKIGDRVFHCWNRDGHGPLTLSEAIMQSCNVYFMQVGRRLGLQRLRTAMEQAGYSHRTGWPLEEQAGHLPQRNLSEGEVAILALGQGELLVTVLQEAVVAGAFANGGWLLEPWVVNEVGGHPVSRRVVHRKLPWSSQTIEAVRTGMRAVVEQPDGTGHRAFSPIVTIAGKTGTAQTHVPGRAHGWFVGFCPAEQPRAAMAIVAEYGGSGGDLPADVAKVICEYLATVPMVAEVSAPVTPGREPETDTHPESL